jgi:hypothetical protein
MTSSLTAKETLIRNKKTLKAFLIFNNFLQKVLFEYKFYINNKKIRKLEIFIGKKFPFRWPNTLKKLLRSSKYFGRLLF